MNLQRKLQKLFALDGLLSAWEHSRRWSHPVDTKPMLAALDPAKLALLRQRYSDPGHPIEVGNSAKWVNAKYWLTVNVERAQDLRLDQRAPVRVLDLGCGSGYFLYVCERLGHQAVGIDIDENPLFRDMIELFGVKRIVGRIDPFTPLPDLGGKYDLVTSHCICFQKTRTSGTTGLEEWEPPEWRYFLDDLRANVLNPGGQVLLDFNPHDDGTHYTPAVREFFRQEGARFFRSKVFLGATSPTAPA